MLKPGSTTWEELGTVKRSNGSGTTPQAFTMIFSCKSFIRPSEICQIENARRGKVEDEKEHLTPEMFVGKRDRFDINQGEIGDC